MTYLIYIYTICPLLFESCIWYILDLTFFLNIFRLNICRLLFEVKQLRAMETFFNKKVLQTM